MLTMLRISPVLLFLWMPASIPAAPWPRHVIDNSSRGADGVRLADANGDGLFDIATGWEEGGLIRVYLNPGPNRSKEPWPAVTVGEVKSPEDAVLVDLDGDKMLDVVSSCEGGNRSIYVHWAPSDPARYLDADGWRTDAVPRAAKQQMWMFALPMQVDGLHGVDLIVGSKGNNNLVFSCENARGDLSGVRWLRHDAGRWIGHEISGPEGTKYDRVELLDLDADGDLDLLTCEESRNLGVVWYENPTR